MVSVDLAIQEQMFGSVVTDNDFYPELDEFLDILKFLIREPSVIGNEDSFSECCGGS